MSVFIKTLRPIGLGLLLLFCFSAAIAQDNLSSEALTKIAKKYTNALKYDSASIYYNLAMEQALIEKDSGSYYSNLISMAFEQSREGKMALATQNAYRAVSEGKPHLDDLNMGKAYRTVAHCLNRGYDPKNQVLNYYDSALSKFAPLEDPEAKRYLAVVNSDLAIYHYFRADYIKAEAYFRRSIGILKTLEMEKVANTLVEQHLNLGAMLKTRGAYNQSFETFELAEQLALKHLEDPERLLGFAYDGMASAIQSNSTNSYQKTIDYYHKALDLINKSGESHESVYSLINLGATYYTSGQSEKALAYFTKAKELCLQTLGPNHIKTADTNYKLAEYYYRINDLEQAKQLFAEVMDFYEESGRKSLTVITTLISLARVHAIEGDKDQALKFIEKLTQDRVYREELNKNPRYLMELAEVYQRIERYDEVLDYCDKVLGFSIDIASQNSLIVLHAGGLKGLMLEKKYNNSGDPADLIQALEGLEKVNYLITEVDANSGIFQDRLTNQNNLSARNQTGFRIARKLYEITGESEYLNKAWHFGEANKTYLTLANLKETIALEKSGIPSDLIGTDADITNSIAYYEGQLFIAESKNDSAAIRLNRNSLFYFRRQKDSLVNIFKEDYPEYYTLRYQEDHQKIEDIQKNLAEDELLINYHVGLADIYAFQITRDQIDLKKLESPDLFSQFVDDFTTELSNPNGPNRMYADSLANLGAEISKILLPGLSELDNYKKLIIIPDSYLAVIPFESLPMGKQSDISSFADIGYLIESVEVIYANSATLLSKLNVDSRGRATKVLGFAPSFGNALALAENRFDSIRSGLNNLAWTEQEVSNVAEYFETTPLFGKDATEQQFRELADQYSIIHIASHGLLNQSDPLYSRLVFAPYDTDSINDGYLNTQELFNMKLPAEMVVLSACNSGSGSIARGEGIISLANGFFYAGSKSLVMSHWTANDQSTAAIIGDFYAHLAEGKAKSTAMRDAKLNYLNQADGIRAHPYYWAHLVVNGNNKPLNSQTGYTLSFVLIVLLGIVVILLARRKNVARNQ